MLKRNFSTDTNSPDTLPKPFPAPHSPTANTGANLAANQAASVIGPDHTVIGDGLTIICKSTLVIAGEVSGDINSDWVTVAETGKVQATISARAVSVDGEVYGELRATTVTLHASARVNSDILQMHLVIAEGAHFDGSVQRAQTEAELQPLLDEVPNPTAAPQPY